MIIACCLCFRSELRPFLHLRPEIDFDWRPTGTRLKEVTESKIPVYVFWQKKTFQLFPQTNQPSVLAIVTRFGEISPFWLNFAKVIGLF